MSQNQEQEEELEVLRAIYEEDDLFNELNETTFQYRFGELGERMSFVLEVQWPETYPECLPNINLNAFYNKHISKKLKEIIIEKINEEIAENIGLAMTFTIFSWVGENFELLMEKHLDLVTEVGIRKHGCEFLLLEDVTECLRCKRLRIIHFQMQFHTNL